MEDIKCEDCCFCKTGKQLVLITRCNDALETSTFTSMAMPFCNFMFNWLPINSNGKSSVIECPEFKARKL